jgi:hypothetical protein
MSCLFLFNSNQVARRAQLMETNGLNRVVKGSNRVLAGADDFVKKRRQLSARETALKPSFTQ